MMTKITLIWNEDTSIREAESAILHIRGAIRDTEEAKEIDCYLEEWEIGE